MDFIRYQINKLPPCPAEIILLGLGIFEAFMFFLSQTFELIHQHRRIHHLEMEVACYKSEYKKDEHNNVEELLKKVSDHSLSREFERRGKEAYPDSKEREFLLNGPSLALYDEVIRRCEDRICDQVKIQLHQAMNL